MYFLRSISFSLDFLYFWIITLKGKHNLNFNDHVLVRTGRIVPKSVRTGKKKQSVSWKRKILINLHSKKLNFETLIYKKKWSKTLNKKIGNGLKIAQSKIFRFFNFFEFRSMKFFRFPLRIEAIPNKYTLNSRFLWGHSPTERIFKEFSLSRLF